MTRSISRTLALLIVALAVGSFAAFAHAQKKEKPPKDMLAKCEKHLKDKIHAGHPEAHKIELTKTREWQPSTTQSGIGGTGSMVGAENKPRTFEWTCVYDTKTQKIVDVDHGKFKVEKPEKKKK
jgi:hypothetical protein